MPAGESESVISIRTKSQKSSELPELRAVGGSSWCEPVRLQSCHVFETLQHESVP